MTDIKLKFDEDDFDEKPMVAEARDDNPARKPAAEASVSQPSVLSPFGRLDRFRALIFVVAATTISYLLIIGLDPALAWLFNTIGVETTNKHGYQLDPIIYASLGVTFFMLAILLVTIKRLRDANFSPFFSILLFMFPIVIPALVPIFMCTLPGSKEDNRFGPAPRRWGIGTYLAAAIFLVGVPIALWSIKDNMLTYLFDLVPKAKETSS